MQHGLLSTLLYTKHIETRIQEFRPIKSLSMELGSNKSSEANILLMLKQFFIYTKKPHLKIIEMNLMDFYLLYYPMRVPIAMELEIWTRQRGGGKGQ